MRGGEARLGGARIRWSVPEGAPGAAGGLEHLGHPADEARGSLVGVEVEWSVREASPEPSSNAAHHAFFGEVRLRVAADAAATRVWSPAATFDVSANRVLGVVHGPAERVALPASIALHVLAAHHGLAHLHAAVVSFRGRTLVLPGGTGSGQTSAALAFRAAGAEVRSDDACYVDPDGEVWPLTRPLHVAERTLRAHPRLEVVGHVFEGTPKAQVAGAVPSRGPTPIDALVFPTLRSGGSTRVEPMDGASAWTALLGSSALAVLPRSPCHAARLELLARLAARPAFRLVAGEDALEDPRVIPAALAACWRG